MPQPDVSLEEEPKEPEKADPLPDAADPVPDWESSYSERSINSLEAQWLALLPLSSELLSWRRKSKHTHPWKLHLSLRKEVHAFTDSVTCWLSSHINSLGLELLALKINGGLEFRITLFMGEINKHLDSIYWFLLQILPHCVKTLYCCIKSVFSADKRAGFRSLHVLLDGMTQPHGSSNGALQGKWESSPDSPCEAHRFSSYRYTNSPFRTLPCSFSWSSLSSPIWIQEPTFFSLPAEIRFLPLSLPRKLERPFLCPCMETDPHGSLFFVH